MKLAIVFGLLVSGAAFASPVTGTAKYTKSWCFVADCGQSQPSFYDLEQMGVERAAEKNAIQNCFQAGYTKCTSIVSVEINECNSSYGTGPGSADVVCSATAIVDGEK